MDLKDLIEAAFADAGSVDGSALDAALAKFVDGLNDGSIRSASPTEQGWVVNTWVKKGILLLFRKGVVEPMPHGGFPFFDKHNLTLRPFSDAPGVRIVPGGSSVRTGSYLAPGVIVMPPSYINIGTYVDSGTLVDSHALVGSCAQVGKNVHLSAGAQLGGVLEPIGTLPVIVEDEAIIGGNSGIFEGTFIGRGAVIGTGVQLTRSTPVYDCVKEEILRATADSPLRIPANAVVVPGARPLNTEFGKSHNLSISTPMIIKYRDAKTDLATLLEEALR